MSQYSYFLRFLVISIVFLEGCASGSQRAIVPTCVQPTPIVNTTHIVRATRVVGDELK